MTVPTCRSCGDAPLAPVLSLGNTIWGGSVWAGVDTPVGPIYVGYGRAEGDRDAVYVYLGRAF